MFENPLRTIIQAWASGDPQPLRQALTEMRNLEVKIVGPQVNAAYNTLMSMIPEKQSLERGGLQSEEGSSLFTKYEPTAKLASMTLAPRIRVGIETVLREQRSAEKLRAHGMLPARRMMLLGPPGTGKTMTAKIMSAELGIPLYHVSQSALIESHLGNTARNLASVFNHIRHNRGVYLFDEFDAVAKMRGQGDDVAEMNRIVNQCLQLLDQDESSNVIVATTNRFDLIDPAIHRRFDTMIEYEDPTSEEIERLVKSVLGKMAPKIPVFTDKSMSHADTVKWSLGLKKELILTDVKEASIEHIRSYFGARAYSPAARVQGLFKVVATEGVL